MQLQALQRRRLLCVGGAVVNFGVAVLTSEPEEADISKMGSTCGKVMQGFENALSDLNTHLYDVKDDLNRKPQSDLDK